MKPIEEDCDALFIGYREFPAKEVYVVKRHAAEPRPCGICDKRDWWIVAPRSHPLHEATCGCLLVRIDGHTEVEEVEEGVVV